MVMLVSVGVFTLLQVWYAKTHGGLTTLEIIVSALVGTLAGECLDFILGYKLGMWHYNFLPYWTSIYWMILPVMWAEFGVGVYISARALYPKWWLTAVMLGIPYEVYGILKNSWDYSSPWLLVAIGWFVMIRIMVWIQDNMLNFARKQHGSLD